MLLHITAGDHDWSPTQPEMEGLRDQFIAAVNDPHGSVVVTRVGVNVNIIYG